MKKKICSLLLALLMVVTMLPVTAMATASNDYTQWRQGDSAWNQQEAWPASQYPNADYRWMSQAGCLVTSVAMLLRHYNVVATSDVNAFNPWICNNALKAAGAFNSAADMYFDGVQKAYPGFVHKGTVAYSKATLASLYSQGYACIVGVNGNGHFVAVKYADSSGATIMDPGWGYTSLSNFSSVNTIYYYSATPSAHTCDRGSFQWTWTAHPHYKCYKCSICGEIWADKTQPTKRDSCEQCYPRTATVTYYNADGAVWKTASGTADASYTLSASYPTKSGSYFVGWSYTAGASSFDLRPNDTVTLKGSIDLYPVYVTHEQAVSGEDVYIYNISDFDSDGYNISSEDHTVQTRVDNSGWTSWSNYSLTEASASSTQQVRTTTMYLYYYFLCSSCGRHEPFWGKSDCGATITTGAWHEGWFDTPYSACNPQSFSYTTSKYYTTSLGDGQMWIFSAGNLNDTSVGTTDAAGSSVVIRTGYSTRQWVTKFNTVDRTATAYRITKAALASGTCGENLTWVLDENGTLTISGTGAMTSPVWWNSYKDSIKTVVIKDGVTTIEEGAFEDCKNLTSITIPASVTKIGDYAFENCTNLTHASIKSNLVSIGKRAFNNCEGLTNINISGSVTKIGDSAFENCANLTRVSIKSGAVSIGEKAFCACTGLTDLALGDGVTSIEKSAFIDCENLASIVLPESVTQIGDYAFNNCKRLASITIPASVTNIGVDVFSGCSTLERIEVDSENLNYTSLDGILFSKDLTKIVRYPEGRSGDYTIPSNVTSIGDYAFERCAGLTNVIIPNSVTSIEDNAFRECISLTNVTIPNGVTYIGYGVFLKCENLTDVVVPSSVNKMNNMVFYDCKNLKNVTLSSNLKSIQYGTFGGCAALETIEIPNSVTCIDATAFASCLSLKSIVIPDSVDKIWISAFSNCTSLSKVVIGNGATIINERAFKGCTALTSITMGSRMETIAENAFADCTALTDVHYNGTEAQWNAINIAAEGNDLLRSATIHFAQPDPQPPVETSGTITVSSVRARAGQTITVKVSLSVNKGISNMRLQMTYPEGFTLENVQKGDALSSLTFTPPGKFTANPVNFVWDGTEADTSEGCILELTFRVADTVAVGDYSISLSYQRDDVLDGDLESIDLTLQDGTVSVVEFTRGDIDGDGVIGMKDLGTLRKYFAGGYDAGNFVMEAADLDGDGGVTMKDLGVLRRYLAGGYDINLGE